METRMRGFEAEMDGVIRSSTVTPADKYPDSPADLPKEQKGP